MMDYRKATPDGYEVHPTDISDALSKLADFGNDTEAEEVAKNDLAEALYNLDTICQNEYNNNYYRTLYNVLARIAENVER